MDEHRREWEDAMKKRHQLEVGLSSRKNEIKRLMNVFDLPWVDQGFAWKTEDPVYGKTPSLNKFTPLLISQASTFRLAGF